MDVLYLCIYFTSILYCVIFIVCPTLYVLRSLPKIRIRTVQLVYFYVPWSIEVQRLLVV